MVSLRIGVVTDSHATGHEREAALALDDRDCDVLAYLGDLPGHMGGSEAVQHRQILDGLENLSAFPGTVFVIPGNYEEYAPYKAAFAEALREHSNLCDASTYDRTFTAKGMELAFLPGSKYYASGFRVRAGTATGLYQGGDRRFWVSDPADLERLVQNPKRAVVMVHNPPQLPGVHAIDVALRAVCSEDVEVEGHIFHAGTKVVGPLAETLVRRWLAQPLLEHTGNPELAHVLFDLGIKQVVAGDIHEAAGCVDWSGSDLSTGRWLREFHFNPGPVSAGDYGLVDVRGDGFGKVERFNLSGSAPRDYLDPYIHWTER